MYIQLKRSTTLILVDVERINNGLLDYKSSSFGIIKELCLSSKEKAYGKEVY